jgi:hypothetical protein
MEQPRHNGFFVRETRPLEHVFGGTFSLCGAAEGTCLHRLGVDLLPIFVHLEGKLPGVVQVDFDFGALDFKVVEFPGFLVGFGDFEAGDAVGCCVGGVADVGVEVEAFAWHGCCFAVVCLKDVWFGC